MKNSTIFLIFTIIPISSVGIFVLILKNDYGWFMLFPSITNLIGFVIFFFRERGSQLLSNVREK